MIFGPYKLMNEEWIARDMHWCYLTGGPTRMMGMIVAVPKQEHRICFSYAEPRSNSIFEFATPAQPPAYMKLTYIRNPAIHCQFDFLEASSEF